MNRSLKAVYPGSFDPLTNGHLDILDRSLKLFGEVTLVVARSHIKSPLFTAEERLELIQEEIKSRPGCKVELWDGLIMDYARENGISAIIRGLRAASDFEYEFMMATMNKQLNAEVETVFMMTSKDLYFVSSTMIKELYQYGGDISSYVPKGVMVRVNKKLRRK